MLLIKLKSLFFFYVQISIILLAIKFKPFFFFFTMIQRIKIIAFIEAFLFSQNYKKSIFFIKKNY